VTATLVQFSMASIGVTNGRTGPGLVGVKFPPVIGVTERSLVGDDSGSEDTADGIIRDFFFETETGKKKKNRGFSKIFLQKKLGFFNKIPKTKQQTHPYFTSNSIMSDFCGEGMSVCLLSTTSIVNMKPT
jgi:hypothetical protein